MLNSGIYIIENTINNKVYVGQSKSLKYRWSNHKSAYKNRSKSKRGSWKLWNAFSKHKIENFNFKIIARCPIEYLDKLEIKFIKLYNSISNGYNITEGGQVGGFNNSKIIYQFDLEGNFIKSYNSITEAANSVNLANPGCITRVAERKKNTVRGFIWTFKKEDIKIHLQYLKNKKLKRKKSCKKTASIPKKHWNKVFQYDKDLTFIQEWLSARHASRTLKINYSSIRECSIGNPRRKTAGGFIWKREPI